MAVGKHVFQLFELKTFSFVSERYEFAFKLTFLAAIRGIWELAKWLVHWTFDLASRIPRIETVFALRRRVC